MHYCSCAAAAVQTVAALHEAGGQAMAFAADLSVQAECEALVRAVLQGFGRIDAVVNHASLFEYDDVVSFSVQAMERAWRANTAPAIILARALHAAGGGCVVNLLDQELWNPDLDYPRYSLSDAPAGITIKVAYLGACGDLLTRQCVPARSLDEGLLVDDAAGAFILFRVAGRSHLAAG